MSLNIEEDKRVTKLTPEPWLSHICNAHGQVINGAVLLHE